MAVVNKTIGTIGRDYSTITLWEAADGGGDGLGNDDCTGSCYKDSVFDEAVTIDFSALSIELTVASGEEHDGTAGTGSRIVRTSNGGIVGSSQTIPLTIDWLEWDGNGSYAGGIDIERKAGTTATGRWLLVHDVYSNGASVIGIRSIGPAYAVMNCIAYGILQEQAAARAAVGIDVASFYSSALYNCTVYDVVNNNGTTGTLAVGVNQSINSANNKISNVIAMGSGGTMTGGTISDFNLAADTVRSNNLSSDLTASGASSLTSKIAANQFVSTSPPDLHLKAAADAIDAGLNLGTTPAGVNLDIDNRDRDAMGDVWDIGAHEYVAPTTGGQTPWHLIAAGAA